MKTVISLEDFCGDGAKAIGRDFQEIANKLILYNNFRVIIEFKADKIEEIESIEDIEDNIENEIRNI